MIDILGIPQSNFVRSVALVCAQKDEAFQIGWQLNGQEVPYGSDAHRQHHPFCKFPIIQDGDTTLTETLAICRYLDAKYPQNPLQPVGLMAQAEHDTWCSRAITQIDQAIIRQYLIEFVRPTGPNGQPNIEQMLKNKPAAQQAVAAIEQQLQDHTYICGDQFTLADALIAPLAHYASLQQGELSLVTDNSPIHAYVAQILRQPGAAAILK